MRSLNANKLRSSLTMLGVIIGVGSVITLMSVGRGAEASITSSITDMGTNLIYLTSKTPGVEGMMSMASPTYSFTMTDAEEIAERVPGVTGVAPTIENYVEVATASDSTLGIVEATTPEFETALNYPTAEGQFITERNVAARDMVVVLGDTVARELFGNASSVGKKVKINGRQFSVIGELEKKGGQMMGVSMDSVIVVPITTYQSRLFPSRMIRGEDAIQQLAGAMESTDVADIV